MRVVLLLLTALYCPPVTPVAVLTALEIAKNSLELVSSMVDVWEHFNRYGQFVKMPEQVQNRQIFDKIDMMNVKLDEMNDNLNSVVKNTNMMVKLLENLPETFEYELHWNTIKNYQIHINTQFGNMQKYVASLRDYEKSTLIEFGNIIVSHDSNSVLSMIQMIQFYVKTTNFLQLLQRQLQQKQGNIFCNEQQSAQQIYHSILKELLLTNSKAYVLTQVAYMFKKMYNEGNYTKEINDANEDFKQRIEDFVQSFNPFISKASRELWRCDPVYHSNETYTQITSLLQGFILNDMNLNNRGSCYDSCSEYSYTQKHNCREDQWCNRQPKPKCPKVINCRFIADEMTVCKASNIKKSGRRYQYVEFGNGKKFGKKEQCPRQQLQELHTYKQSLFFDCSYCFCLCDEGRTQYSDRYINLRAAIADVENNRVVTGIRFIKTNRVIHLQIQEGKLLPEGQIDMETVRWVPPDNYSVTTDKYVYEGQDYHTLTYEERGIDLGTVTADDNHLVTGVRFIKMATRLDLQVLLTPFNISTGELTEEKSYFKEPPNIHLRHSRWGKELKLIRPDIPTRDNLLSFPDDSKATYVKFVNTDFDKDAAQSTVPFFDTQPVESPAPTPLSGLGIFYKGASGSGGFIAPKIITYDFSPRLRSLLQTTSKKKRLV